MDRPYRVRDPLLATIMTKSDARPEEGSVDRLMRITHSLSDNKVITEI